MLFERVHVLNHLKNAKLSVQSSKNTKLHPRRESPIYDFIMKFKKFEIFQ